MAGSWRSCLIISVITNHLGIKPERGGSPPRESRMGVRRAVRVGDLVQEVAKLFRLVQLRVFKARNVTEVITMYRARVRRAIEGANWTTRIIQPK